MSTPQPSADRYSRGAIVLHWLIAVLIIANFIGAWVADDLAKPERGMVMRLHKSAGLLILALVAVRIAWRLIHRAPPLADTLKAWEAMLARAVHAGFYVFMVAMPIAGWAMVSAESKGKPTSFFGLFDIPALPVGFDKSTGDLFHDLHENIGYLLIALFALHIAAVIKHVHIDKDGTLARMLPFLGKRG